LLHKDEGSCPRSFCSIATRAHALGVYLCSKATRAYALEWCHMHE